VVELRVEALEAADADEEGLEDRVKRVEDAALFGGDALVLASEDVDAVLELVDDVLLEVASVLELSDLLAVLFGLDAAHA
jgi:hypothetical protein